MKDEERAQDGGAPREVKRWLVGRKNEVERWVEETSLGAVTKVRGVLAEEIRGLSRRVDRMHELLDQLEQLVDSSEGAQEKRTADEVGRVMREKP